MIARVKEGTYRDEASLDVAVDECLVARQRAQKFDVGRNTDDVVFVQCFAEHSQGLCAVLGVHDELRDHGIIEHADLRALCEALLEAHRRREAGRVVQYRRQSRSA